jgi:ATP-dependent Clp protease adaptor protein ClpS
MFATLDVSEPEAQVRPKRRAESEKTRPKRQPQYAVIVLNDDLHTYDYVIDALCRVCGHSVLNAYHLAKEVDENGRAIVWTGTMELAELKRDQIRGFGPDTYARMPVEFPLGCVIEPLPT